MNIDTRSLVLHKELMLWVYDEEFARRNEQIFYDDLKECSEVTLDEVDRVRRGCTLPQLGRAPGIEAHLVPEEEPAVAGNEEFMRFMAAWALVHETADEGWKAAVERGSGQAVGEMESGPEAFVDGLSAMIAEEKERLKAELASGQIAAPGSQPDLR